MAAEFTPNSNLYKWKSSDQKQTTIQEMANNAQKIDDKFSEVSSQLAETMNNIRNVITPEQYGAVGDGITDDILALEQAQDYAYSNKATLLLSNKTYAISRTLFVKENVEIEGLSNSVIKAVGDFVGDSVIKSFDYDNTNIYSFGIFKVAIDGNWKNVYGIRIKTWYFGYEDLMISNCRLGGLNTDRNLAQPTNGKDTANDNLKSIPRNYKNGRLEVRECGGTSVYWNHHNDSWLGEIECKGVGKSEHLQTDDDISKIGIHIGPQGQCEIDRCHVYGFKDAMKVEARITANLLILESYFDSALIMDLNSTYSQIGKIEVFQNLTPTGEFTGRSEGRNDVPVVWIKSYNGVQINNLFIRQFWADPEKINDTTVVGNPTYQAILDARKTKKCLVIDSGETHIGNLHIVGKHNGALTTQKYYPVGVEINGNHNRIESGQVNFCSTGLITKSRDTGYNFVKLNFYYTQRGWKNTLGTGTRGSNKYDLVYTHDTGGSNSLFTSDWQDIDLDRGERMKFYWANGSGSHFRYPSVSRLTYDLSSVIGNQKTALSNKTGKITKDEEVEIEVLISGSTVARKNIAYTMVSHTQWTSDFYFDNSVAVVGATATVIVRVGLD